MKKRKRTGDLTVMAHFRMSPDDCRLVEAMAKERGQSRSEFLRGVIRLLASQQQRQGGTS